MGGEPERDEGGLPPVHVVIPDDARELDRDVQAYHRELRAARRRRRFQHLIAPFTKHGMVIPLIAGTLVVTLFAGTMLTLITSAPEPTTPMPTPPRNMTSSSIPANASPSFPGTATPSIPAAGSIGGKLPSAVVLIGNKPSPLRDLRPSVLAIVPRGCRCLTALRQLTVQAVATQIRVYLVGTDGWVKQVAQIAARLGVASRLVKVVNDADDALAVYRPAGLTAILVHSDSVVSAVLRKLDPGFDLKAQLRQLPAAGLGDSVHGLGDPATSVP